MKRSLVLSSLVGLVAALLPASPAFASCAELPSLAESYASTEVVFRGTVETFANNTATVSVEEVWKGPPLPATVTVITGSVDKNPNDDSFVASSVDRTVKVGVTYLFFPWNDAEPFRDNICTATQRYEPSLERLREPSQDTDGAGPAVEPGADLPTTGASLLGLLIFSWLVMGAGIGLLVYRKRRALPRR